MLMTKHAVWEHMRPGHFEKEHFFGALREINLDSSTAKPTNINPTFGRSLGGVGNELQGDELIVLKWVMEYMVKFEGTTCFGWLPGYNVRYALYETYTAEQKLSIDAECRTFMQTAKELGVPLEIHIGDHNLYDSSDGKLPNYTYMMNMAAETGAQLMICHVHAQVNLNNARMSLLRGDNAADQVPTAIALLDNAWESGNKVYGDAFAYDFGNASLSNAGTRTAVAWYYAKGIPVTAFKCFTSKWYDSNDSSIEYYPSGNVEIDGVMTPITRYYRTLVDPNDLYTWNTSEPYIHVRDATSGKITEKRAENKDYPLTDPENIFPPATAAEIAGAETDELLLAMNDAMQAFFFHKARTNESALTSLYYTAQEHTFLDMWQKPWCHWTSDGFSWAAKNTHPRIMSGVARAWAVIRDGIPDVVFGGSLNIEGRPPQGAGDDVVMEFINFAATKPNLRMAKYVDAFKGRGQIKVGNYADVIVWDPNTFIDQAFPRQWVINYSERENSEYLKLTKGMHYVFVNGAKMLSEGEYKHDTVPNGKFLVNKRDVNYKRNGGKITWEYNGHRKNFNLNANPSSSTSSLSSSSLNVHGSRRVVRFPFRLANEAPTEEDRILEELGEIISACPCCA